MFVLVILIAYVLAGPISPYDAPGYIRWLLAAYVLVESLALVGICSGAIRRARTLDERLDALAWQERDALDRARHGAEARRMPPPDAAPLTEPTDADVDQLLSDLHRLSSSAAAQPEPEPEPEPQPVVKPTEELRFATGEIERLTSARGAVAAYAAGPALAAAVWTGVLASLLPASDGMLTDVWMNTFVGLVGVFSIIGVAAYAAASFRPRGV